MTKRGSDHMIFIPTSLVGQSKIKLYLVLFTVQAERSAVMKSEWPDHPAAQTQEPVRLLHTPAYDPPQMPVKSSLPE